MIGRLAYFAALLAVALVATMAQLDQQVRRSPGLAPFVPPEFSGNAARERSQMAISAGQAGLALAEARHSLTLRPMPAESLTLLSLAAAEAEDYDLAVAALAASSRRGWREPIAQFASAEAALRQGEYDIASQRIVALLAIGDLGDEALVLLARLVATPAGRDAMAERLAAPGHWQDNTLIIPLSTADPDDWAQTLVLAQAAGAQFSCGQLQRVVRAFDRHGAGEAAVRLQSQDCRAD